MTCDGKPIRGLKANEAAAFFGIGMTKFYEDVLPKWGHLLKPIYIGAGRRFDLNDLNAVFELMKKESQVAPPALDGRTRIAKAHAARQAKRAQKGRL